MIKAGGILAIIAGLLGVLAAVVTLVMGGLGTAFATNGADTVVSMGWGGIFFSLLAVVYGAVAFGAPRAGAFGLALTAIPGMVLGGLLVAVLMALALVAAIMVWLGRKKDEPTDIAASGNRWRGIAATAAAPVLCTLLIGGQVFGTRSGDAEAKALPVHGQVFPLGETVRSGQFEVTVRKLQFLESVGRGLGAETAAPGTIFAVLEVTVRCVDGESRYYSAGDLLVELDGKNLKFDRSEVVLGLESPIGNINPMMEKSGYVVYKIPANAAQAPLYWTPGRSFDKVRIALNQLAPINGSRLETQATANAPNANNIAQGDLAGHYANASGSTVEIVRLANGQLGFSLIAIGPTGNTGEAEGALIPDGESYRYQNPDLDCQLVFQVKSNSIAIVQDGMCSFGMNVSAEGTYQKAAK